MPKKSKSKTALRGSVNNIIIESLVGGEKYGYEIIKEVEEKTNHKVKLKQPSLYSSLKRFEQKDYITSYWQESEIGGKRHYYKITDKGLQYYKKNVLKENDDAPDEYLEDKIEDYQVDEHSDNEEYPTYSFDVNDKLNELLSDDDKTEDSTDELLDEAYEAMDDNQVLSEDDLISDQAEVNKEYVADHDFNIITPIEEKIYNSSETTNAVDDIMTEEPISDNALDDIKLDNLSDKDVEVKPEPVQHKIIVDKDGITKMYYPENESNKKSNKVFDNVIYHTTTIDKVYDAKPAQNKSEKELTEEEKTIKSQNFMQRFDEKSEQIKRERHQAPVQNENKYEETNKAKLSSLYDGSDFTSDEIEIDSSVEKFNSEPVEEYNTTEINTYTVRNFVNEKSKAKTNKYLLVNKAKFIFGIVMLAFMLIELTTMLIVLKNNDMLMQKQHWIFQLGYIAVAVVALFYCIPVFISPSKQATNTFRFGYSIMFGLLAFFISIILVYAINTFMGMELINIKYYASTLIVPTVLAFNFILGPILYLLIIQNKKLYN